MATVTAPSPGAQTPGSGLGDTESRLPDRLARVPSWLWVGGGLTLLMALSAFLRTRYIGGEYWMDEGITTGISLHPIGQIPGVLRYDGNPPLYYMMLHVWMSVFGTSETATHSLSLVCGLLTIPAGGWAGWKLFGARTGIYAAILFAFNAWLTAYAQETRMYEFMGLLGVLATAGFLLGFVYRRRRYLFLFAAALTVMLYTHTWGTFFFAGSAMSLIPALHRLRRPPRPHPRRRVRLHRRRHPLPALGPDAALPGRQYRRAVGQRAPVRRAGPALARRDRRRPDHDAAHHPGADRRGPAVHRARAGARASGSTVWTLMAIPVATLGIAWLESQVNPAFVRPLLRAGHRRDAAPDRLGLRARRAAGPGGDRAGRRLPGQPQLVHPAVQVRHARRRRRDGPVPAARATTSWWASPSRRRWPGTTCPAGSTTPTPPGAVSDPRYMNWVNALDRLTNTNPQATLTPIVNSMKPGQHLLFVRPLTEGAQNWQAPWTVMVRRRSAQWGPLLQDDVDARDAAAGRPGAAQLPRRVLRGRQRRPLPEGLLTVGSPAGARPRPDDHRHSPTPPPLAARGPRDRRCAHAARGSTGCPGRLTAGAVLLVLMVVSAFIRTRTLSGELWFDEAGAVGLASQPLGSLLGAVHRAGAAPLYYVLLHFWISLFGSSETVTHALSLLIGLRDDPGRDVGRVEPGRARGRGSSPRCCSPSARS